MITLGALRKVIIDTMAKCVAVHFLANQSEIFESVICSGHYATFLPLLPATSPSVKISALPLLAPSSREL